MKKLLCTLLAALMVLQLAACGGKTESSASGNMEASTAPAEVSEQQPDSAPAVQSGSEPDSAVPEEVLGEVETDTVALPISEEKLTYSMFMTMPFFVGSLIDSMETDLQLFRTAQEKTNIYFDVTAVNGEAFDEKFQLMVASGDYYDVMDGMSKYAAGYDAAIDEGICMDIYDLVREYAPNYWNVISQNTDTLAQLVTDEGQMATLGIVYKEANSETQGYLIRDDWLSELGMEIPETYDQLHDALAAFRDNYGAGGMYFGGVEDERLAYGYECANGDFMVQNGTVVSGYLMDSYYDFLSMVRDWYAEGLIYSDFFTAATGDYDQLMVSNACGVVQGAATSFSTIRAYLTDEEAENFSIAAMAPVKLQADDELHYSWNQPNYLKRTDAWSIGTTCADPVPLMGFVNYMFSQDGELLFNYGTEGETFEYDENGDPQYTDLVINNPDQPYFFASYLYASNAATEYFPAILDVSASYYNFGDAEWAAYELFRTPSNDGSYNIPNGVSLNAEENEEYAKLESDISTYVEETVNAWVVGQNTLDQQAFDSFKAQLQQMGIDRMVELKQAAYDRYQSKLENLNA